VCGVSGDDQKLQHTDFLSIVGDSTCGLDASRPACECQDAVLELTEQQQKIVERVTISQAVT